MRTRITKMSAIGAAVGLALVASALTPATAAPQPAAFTASSCSGFTSVTTTGSKLYFSGVALRGGDTITASISPAGAGDTIVLFYASGLSFNLTDGPASGFTFRAPADGLYNLEYSVNSPTPTASVSWSFNANCSTATVSPSPTPTKKPGKGGGKGGGKG